MKKGSSIRSKITILYAIMLVIMVSITFALFRYVSYAVLKKTVKSYLVTSVESNIDKIRYREDYVELMKQDLDNLFIEFGDGYLEIDDDFLDEMNNSSCALYTEDGELLYGKNPVAYDKKNNGFDTPKIYELESDGIKYLVYDRKLVGEDFKGLWIRGVVPIKDTMEDINEITKVFVIIIPIVIVICIIIGFIIAAGMVHPINKLIDSTKEINDGNDLSERINVGKGRDEVHQLADSYNKMLDRLESSFESEKQFTSDVSHELRTPLSVINAQLDILDNDSNLSDYQKAEEVIKRQSRRMTILVDDMLMYTRLDRGSSVYVKDVVDLSTIYKDIAMDMSYIRLQNITLESNIEEGIKVYGHEHLLGRILQNLIDNAYKYGKQNGHIYVSLNRLEDTNKVILTVRDDGKGIKKEEQEHIFDRFYRTDKSRSREQGEVSGSGLGLSMVKKIVEYHEGEVEVVSEPEIGSTFTVRFPSLEDR